MNREIKFRVWCNKNKKFLRDFEYPNGHSGLFLRVLTGEMTDIQLSDNEDGYSDISYDFFNPEYYDLVLQQFTGLKDKDDKDIYEGDIMQPKSFIKSNRLKGIVTFSNDGFKLVGNGISNNYLIQQLNNSRLTFNYFTVIGNIYENPELLTTL